MNTFEFIKRVNEIFGRWNLSGKREQQKINVKIAELLKEYRKTLQGDKEMEEWQDLDMAFRVAHSNYLETESVILGMLEILCRVDMISPEALKMLNGKIKDLHRWADEQEIALRKEISRVKNGN